MLLITEKVFEAGREQPSSLSVDGFDNHGNPCCVVDRAGQRANSIFWIVIVDELANERTRPCSIIGALVQIHSSSCWMDVMRSSRYDVEVGALGVGVLEGSSGRVSEYIDCMGQ